MYLLGPKMPIPFVNLAYFSGSVSSDLEFVIRDPSLPVGQQFYRITSGEIAAIPSTALSNHINTNNPHNVTPVDIGLGNVINAQQLTVSNNLSDVANPAVSLNNLGGVGIGLFNSHALSTTNPHGVTASQTGAYTTAQVDGFLATKADINHVSNVNNPHGVTAVQVGSEIAQWNASKIQNIPVNTANLADGSILVYNSTAGEYQVLPLGAATGISNIASATDTSINAPTENQILAYEPITQVWTNLDFQNIGIASQVALDTHTTDFNNPHQVTASDLGLDQLLNELQLTVNNNLSDLTDVNQALLNLGIGTLGLQDSSAVFITGGLLAGVSLSSLSAPLAIEDGGTGASDIINAANNLGVIPNSEKGSAGGVATLDVNTKIPVLQIPYVPVGEVVNSVTNQVTLPVSNSRIFSLTLTETSQILNPPTTLNNGVYYLLVQQDLVGGHQLAFGSEFIVNEGSSYLRLEPGSITLYRILKAEGHTNLYVSNLSLTKLKERGLIGDAVAVTFIINHNFNTRDVDFVLYEAVTPFTKVSDSNYTLEHTDENNITITFGTAPTLDQYRYVVWG